MATGTVVFQSSTLATPAANLAVMADAVNDSDHGAGTTQYVKIMDGATAGTAKASVTTANGLLVDVSRVQGTVQALGSVQVHGTLQALGTVQSLAGSVHLASNLPGGSINAQGVVAHDSAAAGNPLLIGGFGSSGTQAAVGDGDVVRFAADLNGRLWTNVQTFAGTLGGGTIQVHGTAQALGTFQSHGTNQALGTFQPLAGSVHLATNLPGGTVVAVGSALHDAAADNRPLLIGGFGSSGTQAAVADGDAVRLWADLNGRLQVRGTIDSMPTVTVTATNLDIRDLSSASDSVTVTGTVQTHGTSQVLGTVQTHGTSQVLGTVQAHGTIQVLGTVQTHGTSQALGTIQLTRSSSGAITSVDAATSNTALLGITTGRFGAAFYAEGPGTLFLKLGVSASTTSYTARLNPNDYYELPFAYTGSVTGIWGTASGTVRITEVT